MGFNDVSLVKISEREYKLGETTISLGKDGIITEVFKGQQSLELALKEKEAILALAELVDGPVALLVDISGGNKPPLKARLVYRELTMSDKIGKVALVSSIGIHSVFATFLIAITTKKDIRFFKSKERALEWIRE